MTDNDSKPPPAQLRPLLTLEMIEQHSGLSASHVRRAIRANELPCLRFGRAIRVEEDAYLAYLARHRRGKRHPK
jgi:excisionase family DNA binding protein